MRTDPSLGHAEDGQIVSVEGFDYDEVDKNVFAYEPESDLEEFTPDEMEAALKVLRVLLQWIWQGGMKNPNGIMLRAIIICWIFLKELRPMTLTEVATGFGKKKQSLGRWVKDFKQRFRIRTCHMRCISPTDYE
jgi:hypothetical protein